MFQRTLTHLSLILLFAFTQMGVATHAISHLSETKQQQQQDKSSHESKCGQCISYSHAADTHSVPTFTFDVSPLKHTLVTNKVINTSSHAAYFYSARAPPLHSQT